MSKASNRSHRALNRREAVLLASGVLFGLAPVNGYGTIYLAPEKAIALIFPGQTFARHDLTLTAEQCREIQRRSGVRVRDRNLEAWRSPAGDIVFIDRVLGKHEFITYACGIDSGGAVKQIEILEYRETYGHEIRDDRWRRQFVGKRAADPIKLDADIQNISGATLSCKHIADGVKRLLASFEVALGDPAARTAVARHVRRS